MQVILLLFFSSLLILFSNFKINYRLMPLFFFTIFCLISALFSEQSILSFKRSIMILLPTLIIVNYYSTYDNIHELTRKFIIFFISFSSLVCIFSLIIFLLDNNISLSTKNFNGLSFVKFGYFELGQFYSSRTLYNDFLILRPSSLFSNTIGFSHIVLISYFLSLYKFVDDKNIIYLFLVCFFFVLYFGQ